MWQQFLINMAQNIMGHVPVSIYVQQFKVAVSVSSPVNLFPHSLLYSRDSITEPAHLKYNLRSFTVSVAFVSQGLSLYILNIIDFSGRWVLKVSGRDQFGQGGNQNVNML